MSNTIDYGLKFNTKDLERVLDLTKQTDKEVNKQSSKTKSQKAIEREARKREFLEIEALEKMKVNYIRAENKARKQALKDIENANKNSNNSIIKNEANVNKKYENSIKERMRISREKMKLEKTAIERRLKGERQLQVEITKTNNAQMRGMSGVSATGTGRTAKATGIRDAISSPATRVAKYIGTATVLYGGLAALRRGRDAMFEYDQALQNTYAALGDVTEAEKKMIEQVTKNQNLTRKYGKSFAEIATAMEVLAKAGLTASESMVVLDPALGLAVAGSTDVATAVEYLTEGLNGMRRPLGDASRYANLLAQGANASTVDVKDLAESMKIAGSAGTAFGLTMEETVTWMSAFGTTGLKGRQAANALARDLLRITKESESFKKVGINVFDPDTKKLRNFRDILRDVANANLDITEKQKLLGIYAFKSNEQILASVNKFDDLFGKITLSNNALDDMVNTKMEGLVEVTNRLKASWDNMLTNQGAVSNFIKANLKMITAVFEYIGSIGLDENANWVENSLKRQASNFAMFEEEIKENTKEELEQTKKNYQEYINDLEKEILESGSDLDTELAIKSAKRYLQLINTKLGLIKNVPSKLVDTGAGSGSKFDDMGSFYRKLQKLRNDANNRETTQLAKQLQDNQDLYDEHFAYILDKNISNDEQIKAEKEARRLKDIQDEKAYYDEELRIIKEAGEKEEDARTKAFEHMENLKKEFNDIRSEFDLQYQIEQLQIREDELLDMQLNEEAKFAIREAYSQKTIDLLSAQYEKEHQISAAFWGGIKAGTQALTNSLIDMDMTGKERREQIWTAFRDFFIQTLAEMAVKYIVFSIITNMLSGGFSSGLGSFLGGAFGVNAGSFGGAGGGGASGGGAIFGQGGFVLNNGGGGGFNVPGKISSNNNSDIVNTLQQVEKRIAAGNAQTIRAMEDNKMIISGKFIGEPEIYSMSKNGERKRKFITT